MNLSILLVEDEPSIADTLAYVLSREGFQTTRVATIAEARASIESVKFSAIVLDVGLPDGNGFEFCKEVRRSLDIPILFLTARSDEVDRIVGLEIGADDYVTKPFSPREVAVRLKNILRRVGSASKPKNSCKVDFQVDLEKRRVLLNGEALELSRYEYGILTLLLSHRGQVYSRQMIMDRVWEEPGMALDRTVDTHIKTLRGKLKKIDSTEDYLLTHRGVGYSIKD